MRLSVFTTLSDPTKRGDLDLPALACYSALADEVVVVNGSRSDLKAEVGKYKIISHEWADDFDWKFIGEQFNRGYQACTGDWVIHCDLDFIFHEKDFGRIRRVLEENSHLPAMSFYKWQFILPDRYNLKSRLILAVNKKQFGERIKFNAGGDLCQPSLDGVEISQDSVPQSGIEFYNYEKIAKTYSQVQDDVWRMAKAWTRTFDDYRLGDSPEHAFDEWVGMMKGRFEKPSKQIPLSEHPTVMQPYIASLKPQQWGYNGFGLLPANNYVKMGGG